MPSPLLLLLLVFGFTMIAGTILSRARARARIRRVVTRGKELLEQGKREEAILYLDELIRLSGRTPEREEGLFLLGRTLEQLGRKLEAQRAYMIYLGDFEESGAEPQRLTSVNQRLGNMLLKGKTELSPWRQFLEDREDAVATPESRLFGLKDGRHMLELGRFDEAELVLDRLARHPDPRAPGREAAILYLSLAYEGMHRPEDAIRTYLRYVDEYVEARAVDGDPEIRAVVEGRLRNLEEDYEQARRIPWESFREELKGVRARVPLLDGEGPTELPAAPEPQQRPDLTPQQVRAELSQLTIGQRVGDYVLAEKLGEGGFGEVFRALLPVAIKFARNSESVERLRRFAELQDAVESQRIVRPLEVNLDADPPHVVMEFVDGPNLRQLLKRGRLESQAALPILSEVALALRDAHQAGVAHLDLKPENVLLDVSGAVKLTDFDLGLSDSDQRLQGSLTFESENVPQGTLAYMSPEQRAGKTADARSDVYTFGVCLFEALTGTLPEPGDKPSDFVEDLPAGIDALFERCFARRDRRYADATELCAELEEVLAKLPRQADLHALFADLPRSVKPAIPRSLRERPEPRPSLDEAFERDPKDEDIEREPRAEAPQRPDLDALIAARAAKARERASEPPEEDEEQPETEAG